MKFSAAFVVLSSVVAVLATTPAQVVTDIQGLTTQALTVDSDVNSITTTNISGTLAVHTAVGNLITLLNQATSDCNAITPKPVSESDGATMLNAFKILEPAIVNTAKDYVAKKSIIAAVPIGGLVALYLQDLKKLNTATSAFEACLLTSVPADIRSQATPIVTDINLALSNAISVFSS